MHEHIVNTHPRDFENDQIKYFKLTDEIGNYPNPCSKKDYHITRLSQEIGIGPSMFLLTIKQTIWLFFIFTVLNIPIYIILNACSNSQTTSLKSYLSILSLASLNVKTEMNYIIREEIVKLAPNWPRVQCQYLIFKTGILQIKLN